MVVTSPADQSKGSRTLCFRTSWVRERARAVGYTRMEDLAAAAGITRQSLHRFYSGAGLPNQQTGRDLAKALHCMVEDLTEEVEADAGGVTS